MIGSRFSGIAMRKSEIAAGGPLVPTSMAPSDDRSGKPAGLGVFLSRKYPIRADYVNLGVGSYRSSSNTGLSILCPREWLGIRVVNHPRTQLMSNLNAFYGLFDLVHGVINRRNRLTNQAVFVGVRSV